MVVNEIKFNLLSHLFSAKFIQKHIFKRTLVPTIKNIGGVDYVEEKNGEQLNSAAWDRQKISNAGTPNPMPVKKKSAWRSSLHRSSERSVETRKSPRQPRRGLSSWMKNQRSQYCCNLRCCPFLLPHCTSLRRVRDEGRFFRRAAPQQKGSHAAAAQDLRHTSPCS
jgi:hypothetical protein